MGYCIGLGLPVYMVIGSLSVEADLPMLPTSILGCQDMINNTSSVTSSNYTTDSLLENTPTHYISEKYEVQISRIITQQTRDVDPVLV